MNIGDKLYCWNSHGEYFNVGNWYSVDEVDDASFWLISYNIKGDVQMKSRFVYDVTNWRYYGNNFYSIKEIRKLKLERLEEINNKQLGL